MKASDKASINRSFSMPLSLYSNIVKKCDREKISINSAARKAFELWLNPEKEIQEAK